MGSSASCRGLLRASGLRAKQPKTRNSPDGTVEQQPPDGIDINLHAIAAWNSVPYSDGIDRLADSGGELSRRPGVEDGSETLAYASRTTGGVVTRNRNFRMRARQL